MSDSLLASPVTESEWGPARRPRKWPDAPEWRRKPLDSPLDNDDALAWTLWLALRRVRDWVDTPPDDRASYFDSAPSASGAQERANRDERAARWADARAAAPELHDALTTLATLWTEPVQVQVGELAEACDQVSEWAENRALNETALQFAEAAAALEPEYRELGRPCLIQEAGASRSALAGRLREAGNAVLFGTESFWTGIDVPVHVDGTFARCDPMPTAGMTFELANTMILSSVVSRTDKVMLERGLNQNSVSVEMDFAHPDSQPSSPEWANNRLALEVTGTPRHTWSRKRSLDTSRPGSLTISASASR